jgi:inosine-uridine nucleoside N-ribohydrolase
MEKVRPVIIDTDPGIDDAIAILLALKCPELEIRGLTTVAGNIAVERTTANAARVLALGGITPGGLPIAMGMRGPLVGARVPDEPVHGANGLGGVELPDVQWPVLKQHAVAFMADQVLAEPGQVSIIALGPLTNVAALIQLLPDPTVIREIVAMGGNVGCAGNSTPSAEFNIWADPEAARVVLHSGVPFRLVGLNVTRQALLRLEDTETLAAEGGGPGKAIAAMSCFYIERYRKVHGVAACAMHDPLAVAAAARPDLLRWEPYYVDVECHGELTRGMTVADLMRKLGKEPNVQVAMGVSVEAFRSFLMTRLLGGGV